LLEANDVSSMLDFVYIAFHTVTTRWIVEKAKQVYGGEIRKSTQSTFGLRLPGGAKNLKEDHIMSFSIPGLCKTFAEETPNIWGLITHLLDVDPVRRRKARTKRKGTTMQNAHPRIPVGSADDVDQADSDWESSDCGDGDGLEGTSAMLGHRGGSSKQANDLSRRKRLIPAVSANTLTLFHHSYQAFQKAMQILSTLAQSNNTQCNLMQTAYGFFTSAKNTPASVQEVSAHNGTSISTSAIAQATESVIKEHRMKLKQLGSSGLTGLAFDNLDFLLKVGASSQANRDKFESITTGLFFRLEHGVTKKDLERPYVSPLSEDALEKRVPNRHITPVPKLTDALTPSPVRRRVNEGMIWVIRKILVGHWAPQHRGELGDIPSSVRIPIKKTTHHSAFAVHEKVSGNDGNIAVIENFREQAAIDEELLRGFVLLVRGDLGVLDRIKSILASRQIERTDIESMEYLETVPGLFHVLMACADAIWRIYLQPKALHEDPSGIWKQFCLLNPSAQAKLNTHPGFRIIHDGVDDILTARILDCGRIISKAPSIDAFNKEQPSWDGVKTLASEIHSQFVMQATHTENDIHEGTYNSFSNSCVFLRDALLYRVLVLSMRYGAIGLVEDTITQWIPIFKATKKHKYAAHMLEFLTRLRALPERLARAIRLNWLCNPSGRRDGFRAVDWLVELNNLYIKVSVVVSTVLLLSDVQQVVYSGEGPNRTIKRILDQSGIIEIYRNCHENIENNFEISQRTVNHAKLNMDADIHAMRVALAATKAQEFTDKRKTEMVDDNYIRGYELLGMKKGWLVSKGEEEEDADQELDGYEVDSADLVS
jgi:hypothetical protein